VFAESFLHEILHIYNNSKTCPATLFQVDVMLVMRVSRNNLTLASKILFKLARDDVNDHQATLVH
jgi:hypothetical protein